MHCGSHIVLVCGIPVVEKYNVKEGVSKEISEIIFWGKSVTKIYYLLCSVEKTQRHFDRSGEIRSKADFSTRLRLARNDILNSFLQGIFTIDY
jgi:hypothetical protein